MEIRCPECTGYLATDHQLAKNQAKIKWVLCISLAAMIAEVSVGYFSRSMALTAEGWHMGSHAGALMITLGAYWLAKSPAVERRLSFGGGKLIPLGGYTSAIVLGCVAILIFIESAERLFQPVSIQFGEALAVAIAGFCVNLVSAFILRHDHGHGHDHCLHVHDHNIKSASVHVLADAVTSLLAVLALFLGNRFNLLILDPIVGLVGAVVIFNWAFQLCRNTGWELLDGHSKTIDWNHLRELVETQNTKILDFHIWRIAPRAVACELIVEAENRRGHEHYREILREHFSVQHVVIEERVAPAAH